MRGADQKQGNMLCLISPDMRVPKNHPLRSIRRVADEAFREMDEVLAGMYSRTGRPSIPPRAAFEILYSDGSLFDPQ